MKMQFTFYNTTHEYKPISITIVPKQNETITQMYKRAYIKLKIERQWTDKEIKKYNYTKWRFRQLNDDGSPYIKVNKIKNNT